MSSEWDGGGARRRAPRTGLHPFFGMYSRAEQILSRYRPIAPKPPAPKPDQANPPTTDSATAAAPQSSTSVSPSYRKGRKRSASNDPALASPRVAKRAASAGTKRNQAAPGTGASVVPVVEVGALPMNVPCKSVVVPALPSSSSCNLSSTSLPSATPGPLVQSTSLPEVAHESGVVWKMVPSSPWCERIRVGRAAAAPDTPRASPCPASGCKSYEPFRHGGTVGSDSGSIDSGGGGYHSNQRPCRPLVNPAAHADGGECEEDERPKLVTLSLLPDTPSRREPEEYSGAVSDASRSDVPVPLRLSLFSGGEQQQHPSFSQPQMPSSSEQQQRHWHRQEQSTSGAASSATIDVGYLEQAYGTSSDPVMLTAEDGSGRVLWANLAYKRVVSDRLSGKAASAGPYIDPLGLPTQLGRFTFRPAPPPPPPPTDCGAVLWGFLKKFMLLRGNAAGPDRLVEHQQLHQGQQQQLQRLLSPAVGRSMPIVAQPVRPAPAASPRAILCLECISEGNYYSGYLVGSLDSVTTQLERSSLPALVTDRSSRVKWMNSAFNQLVSGGDAGVDDGSGILVSSCTTSTTTTTTSRGLFHHHQPQQQQQQQQRQSELSDEGKVCFTFETDKSPYSAVSLAGQMRLDLVDSAGRHSCLANLACEMRRLDDEHFGNSWFVWKLSSRPPERKTNLSLST